MQEKTGHDSSEKKPTHNIRHYIRLLANYRPGQLAINTMSGTFWQAVRVICQILTVILMARALGPDGYGTLVGFGGLAITLGCVVWAGGSYLLLQAVSGDHTLLSRYWYATLHTLISSGLILSVMYILAAPALLRMPLGIAPLIAIALSELLCAPLVYACSFVFQAHEKLGWSSALPTLLTLCRLLGIGTFSLATNNASFAHYTLFHLMASLLAASCSWLIVQHKLHPKYQDKTKYSWREFRQGLSFSATALTTGTYSELDKILAVRYLSAGPAGAYAIAYRLIAALVMPVVSLLLAAQPRIFRYAHNPHAPELRRLLITLALTTQAYAIAAAGVVVLFAPLLTSLLGTAFTSAVDAARILALLLPLLCLRLLAVTLLIGLGHPARRAAIELLAAGILLSGAVILTPLYGLTGLISSILIAEAILIVTLLWMLLYIYRKKDNP